MDIRQLDKTFVAGTYARFPLAVTGGKGTLVWDDGGKEYIDLTSGIAVNTFGIADDEWIRAVTEQIGKVQHISNLYYTAPDALLAEALCRRTGMKKVFFSNSGAEANECAVKTARKYAADKKGKEYFTVITLQNSFHGRTITTLAATGQDVFHRDFTPLTEGFVHAAPNDTEDLRKKIAENKCAAIMMEVVQGEGGVAALDKTYVREVAALAEKEDILLICDEVQCGNGRTGKLYGYMHYDITPDIVTTAKGLGGGLPIGATMFGEKTKDVLGAGDHGSTFGGNPVCCAAAKSVLDRLDDTMLTEVTEKAAFIRAELENAPGVRSVSGLGLMIGIEPEKDAGEVISRCLENGVMVLKAKNKVRLLPPLNIPLPLLVKAVGVLKEALAPERT